MIDLTPLEVRKKKGDFARAFRGYQPALVDDFLDLVADRMEELVRETLALQEKVARLEEQLAGVQERERALANTLMAAQEMREELRRQAEREAELTRREAEAEATRIRFAAQQVREREEEVIRQLRARRAQLIQSYRAFLERELTELAAISGALELDEGAVPAAPKTAKPVEPARVSAAPQPPRPTEESKKDDLELAWLSSLVEGET